MSMETHVSKVCSRAFFGLYKIRQIRGILTVGTTKTLVHAFVTSHLDYCNALLYGITEQQYGRLQRVLNAAARVTCLIPKFDRISPVLMRLHLLPVKARVEFKIPLLTYKAVHGAAPAYLTDMVQRRRGSAYSLRADAAFLLQEPRTRCIRFGDRSFYKAAPLLWNRLPTHIRLAESKAAFGTILKAHHFRVYFKGA
ncbi:uncharacterized protein LOC135498378 [Lineus longissimus]|uniref:uncharacterized protein LOC135498378 n=1 Tax=Lineus longissimus TaxID=88925 RepID=UPI00315D1E73